MEPGAATGDPCAEHRAEWDDVADVVRGRGDGDDADDGAGARLAWWDGGKIYRRPCRFRVSLVVLLYVGPSSNCNCNAPPNGLVLCASASAPNRVGPRAARSGDVIKMRAQASGCHVRTTPCSSSPMNLGRHTIAATRPVHILDARFDVECDIFTAATPAGFAVYQTFPLTLIRKRGAVPVCLLCAAS